MGIKQEVYEDLEDYETNEEKINYLKDVCSHGCASGIVSRLVYYKDTNDFYNEHEEEIEDLLQEYKEMCGYKSRPETISNLNGSAEDLTQEKNLLAWFAYEYKAKEILEEDFNTEY